jgi:hypothetical protein
MERVAAQQMGKYGTSGATRAVGRCKRGRVVLREPGNDKNIIERTVLAAPVAVGGPTATWLKALSVNLTFDNGEKGGFGSPSLVLGGRGQEPEILAVEGASDNLNSVKRAPERKAPVGWDVAGGETTNRPSRRQTAGNPPHHQECRRAGRCGRHDDFAGPNYLLSPTLTPKRVTHSLQENAEESTIVARYFPCPRATRAGSPVTLNARAHGVWSRGLMGRIEPESLRLFCPGFADVFKGREALEGLQSLGVTVCRQRSPTSIR